ncbi:MAG: proline dehydrogenase family protein [Candidatus Kapabacteria bacterium]|nr:proline dehydrogenase family protein [Candidatus Kapabacteria bacterium]
MKLLDSLISALLPFTPKPMVRVVAKKYIAGETLNDAMATVARLNGEETMATVDVLGEFVKNPDVARQETNNNIAVLEEMARRGLDANLSVKLTSLGLDIDKEFCWENVRRVVGAAARAGNFVRIDMENSPYTDSTIELARRARAEFPGHVGIVLQAYLRRTQQDIRQLAAEGMHFRLCKGIYVESETIAFKGREEVQQNYLDCLNLILDHGCYVGIATHDDVLIDGARNIIAERKLNRQQYEFQMLLGVRDPKRRELIGQGHRLRVYVPFGRDWYGYSIRRLKENPSIAGHVFKAIFTGD